jgi:hypothetical protein
VGYLVDSSHLRLENSPDRQGEPRTAATVRDAPALAAPTSARSTTPAAARPRQTASASPRVQSCAAAPSRASHGREAPLGPRPSALCLHERPRPGCRVSAPGDSSKRALCLPADLMQPLSATPNPPATSRCPHKRHKRQPRPQSPSPSSRRRRLKRKKKKRPTRMTATRKGQTSRRSPASLRDLHC